jgi:hypothetical protein
MPRNKEYKRNPVEEKRSIHDEMKISRISAKKMLQNCKKQEIEKQNTHVWLTSADGKTKILKKKLL